MNFTFEGLAAATNAIDRLRTFHARMLRDEVAGCGGGSAIRALAREARAEFRAALANDLNTAEARAAICEMVRAANARADAGQFSALDVPAILEALREFDRVFGVLVDHDAEWTKFALEWAEREGKLNEAAPEVLATRGVTDEKIQALVEERTRRRGGGISSGRMRSGTSCRGWGSAGGLERGDAVEAEVKRIVDLKGWFSQLDSCSPLKFMAEGRNQPRTPIRGMCSAESSGPPLVVRVADADLPFAGW